MRGLFLFGKLLVVVTGLCDNVGVEAGDATAAVVVVASSSAQSVSFCVLLVVQALKAMLLLLLLLLLFVDELDRKGRTSKIIKKYLTYKSKEIFGKVNTFFGFCMIC